MGGDGGMGRGMGNRMGGGGMGRMGSGGAMGGGYDDYGGDYGFDDYESGYNQNRNIGGRYLLEMIIDWLIGFFV